MLHGQSSLVQTRLDRNNKTAEKKTWCSVSNELVSIKVGIAVDLYAKVACRSWMEFSILLASRSILQHWKREQ